MWHVTTKPSLVEQIHILRLFYTFGMEVDDVTKGDKMNRGQDDQVTKWPATKWPGDEMTGTKWPGTKWKGTNRRVTDRDYEPLFMTVKCVIIKSSRSSYPKFKMYCLRRISFWSSQPHRSLLSTCPRAETSCKRQRGKENDLTNYFDLWTHLDTL
jgi:hypothetical protein